MEDKLTKYEIASVTAGVPSTEDEALNAIITTSLRFRTAAQILAAHRTRGFLGNRSELVRASLEDADTLIRAFTEASPDGQKTKT